MSFFRSLFKRSARPVVVQLLEESNQHLRLGMFAYLCKNRYDPLYGNEQANLWAVAVLNTVLVEEATNEEGRTFYETNRQNVMPEALKLRDHPLLAECASYLYAAQVIYLATMTMDPLPEHSRELAARATELGLYIPNTFDICGSSDAAECSRRIADFATEFFARHGSRS